MPTPTSEAEIRKQLEAKMAVLKARFARIDDHLHNRNRELPDDWSDRASMQSGEEVVEALEPATLNEIEAVQKALERLDAGNWQVCESCKGEIEPRRLALLPTTHSCAKCAKKNA